MSKKPDLLPCPFEEKKKHKTHIMVRDTSGRKEVVCVECNISIPYKRWNTRHLPPDVEAVLEALKEMVRNAQKQGWADKYGTSMDKCYAALEPFHKRNKQGED